MNAFNSRFKLVVCPFMVLVISFGCSGDTDPIIPELFFETSQPGIILNQEQTDTLIYLINEGNVGTDWTIDERIISLPHEHLSLSPTEGFLNPGDSVAINLHLDRSGLTEYKTYDLTVGIVNAENSARTVFQISYVYYIEEKNLIKDPQLAEDEEIINIHFDDTNELFLLLTNRRLLKIDPSSNQVNQLIHVEEPRAISISQDNEIAVIGFDNKYSVIGLSDLSILHENEHEARVFDIVITTNSWIYLSPQGFVEDGDFLYSLNYETNEEYRLDHLFYERASYVELHPSEDFIYVKNSESSSSPIIRFNISNGAAEYTHAIWPEDQSIGCLSDVNILEHGNQLTCNTSDNFGLFQIGDTEENDLGFIKSIDLDASSLGNFDYSFTEDSYYISHNYTPKKYNAEFEFVEEIVAPKWLSNDGFEVDSGAVFACFLNSDESQLIMLGFDASNMDFPWWTYSTSINQ